ncbi:hypothetical protein FHS82_000997 [Pseudochelatococcus lubricantis]|uniref:Uncharacterized protein n=1 Tax=Pseudochelatococcus lubricantis TaxID=1538102 RepID=A0ABX0V273_9HYPH|nr:hypothetical protein [Pseudochelatococcus lubricantis]NIJ57171.1 hypothetical protein [Pseudochelatococcus lubricantis]
MGKKPHDLSSEDASIAAAKSRTKYYGIQWKNTFSDMGEYPRWDDFNEPQQQQEVIGSLVSIYSYLHYRSDKDDKLEAERLEVLRCLTKVQRKTLAAAMGVNESDLSPRARRRAYGVDANDHETLLPLFALETGQSCGLLLEGFRRAEIRRLEYKAYRIRSGSFDDAAKISDEGWSRRNAEIFGAAEALSRLTEEARLAHLASENGAQTAKEEAHAEGE